MPAVVNIKHHHISVNLFPNTQGMDALAQLYGPFNLDNDSLPQFDDDGKTRDKGSKTRLSSQLQIATSEGCCRRDGTEIDAMVSPGRYVLIIFHCSIGANENQIYSVTYNLDTTAPFKELSLGKTAIDDPLGRSVDLLYIVTNANGSGMLLTQNDQSFKIQVFTDDADTQKQVRIGVYAYAGEEVLPDSNLVDYVSYRYAWWGEDVVSFEASQNEVRILSVLTMLEERRFLNSFISGPLRSCHDSQWSPQDPHSNPHNHQVTVGREMDYRKLV